MSIKIVIEHWEYSESIEEDICVSTDEAVLRNVDSNLIECVQNIGTHEGTAYFDRYYPMYFTEIPFEGCFPFILKNGKYEWHVPTQEVSVRDFMNTHNISDGETITLYEGGIGGGLLETYISVIVDWIPILLNDAGMAFTATQIYKMIMPIYHKLIGKNNKVASPYEFLEMLRSSDTWTMKELQARTTLDENTIECMLMQGGFNKVESEHLYRRSETDDEDLLWSEDNLSIEEDLWGEYHIYNANEDLCLNEVAEDEDLYEEDEDPQTLISELLYVIHSVNQALTSLKIQSEYHKSDFFDFMMKIIECHINRWNEYLYHGKKLRFIKTKVKLKEIPERELSKLLESTESILEYISHFCELLDKCE